MLILAKQSIDQLVSKVRNVITSTKSTNGR